LAAKTGGIPKSLYGIPEPVYPPGIDLRKEARTARRRFYPTTVLYSAYAVVLFTLGFRVDAAVALRYLFLGVALWTCTEYLVHRFVLHGRFPDGPGWLRHALHLRFDRLHSEHHQRPWDGMHINGRFETLPFAVVLAASSLLAPLPTAPVLVAALLESYVIEEWVHYQVHCHRFHGLYFDYIRRHHLYHHSPRGVEIAFGLSNGFWDVALGTRIPPADRQLLHHRRLAR
jgi:dihydroceramide fatty acyl 2-hydroxylase